MKNLKLNGIEVVDGVVEGNVTLIKWSKKYNNLVFKGSVTLYGLKNEDIRCDASNVKLVDCKNVSINAVAKDAMVAIAYSKDVSVVNASNIEADGVNGLSVSRCVRATVKNSMVTYIGYENNIELKNSKVSFGEELNFQYFKIKKGELDNITDMMDKYYYVDRKLHNVFMYLQ